MADDEYMTPEEFAGLPSAVHHAVWDSVRRRGCAARVDTIPAGGILRYHRAQVAEIARELEVPVAERRLAITPEGIVKSVSAFSKREKWWCDGEDCDGGPLGPSLPVAHVHPYSGPALAVDLLTGRTAP